MGSASNRMEIEWIEVGKLSPNRWNPNRMGVGRYGKLCREIEARGFAGAVVVRPAPEGEGYEVVDGEHRLRIARELGLAAMPCVVLTLTEPEAKIKALQMNGLRGENDPTRLAALLAELYGEMGASELEKLVPWSAEEVEQLAALAEDAKDTESKLLHRARATGEFTYQGEELWSVVVTRSQRDDIERAVAKARRDDGLTDDGRALAAVCRRYAD